MKPLLTLIAALLLNQDFAHATGPHDRLEDMAGTTLEVTHDMEFENEPHVVWIEQAFRPGFSRIMSCNLIFRRMDGRTRPLRRGTALEVTRIRRFDLLGYNVTTLYFDHNDIVEQTICRSERARDFFGPFNSTQMTFGDFAQTYCGFFDVPGVTPLRTCTNYLDRHTPIVPTTPL